MVTHRRIPTGLTMASAEQTNLTRREAAELLETSERNVRRLIELGRIPVHPGPKGSRILRREDVLRYRSRTSEAVTQEHAAQVLDVDVRTVRRMLKDGRLAPIEMESGRLRVARSSLDALALSYELPEDETGHEDATGQVADETGHDGSDPDMTGHADPDMPGSRPDIADDLVPIAGLAPLDAPPRAPTRRTSRRRPIAAGLIGLAAVAAATLAIVATRGDDRPALDTPDASPAAIAASTTIVAAAPAGGSTAAASVPPKKATPPKKTTKAQGGTAKPVSDPVRRKKKRRPKPAATTPSAQADATPPPSDPSPEPTPEPTPPPDPPADDPAPAGDPVCEDVYGLEGLC